MRDIRKAVDGTNKRVDELRVEVKTEINLNTQRIDQINWRIDDLSTEVSYIRGDLNRALSQKEIIDDVLTRIGRLEVRVLEAG